MVFGVINVIDVGARGGFILAFEWMRGYSSITQDPAEVRWFIPLVIHNGSSKVEGYCFRNITSS